MAYVATHVRVTAAQIAGGMKEMDLAAQKVMYAAKTLAAQHRETGNYINSFSIVTVPGERGTGTTVDDRLVVNDDPGAAAIEWGHLTRYKNARRVTYVPGQHIMGRAIKAVV